MPPSSTPDPIVETPPDGDNSADMTARALELRLRQQEILAELGVLALQGTPFPELIDRTVVLTAEGLQAEFCKVLEFLPPQNCLLVRAGVGWAADVIGKATVGADLASPAGFALRTGKPVISNHLSDESRFRTPELLLVHGIHRAMNVILQGEGKPFGVLEVDSRSEGEFTEHDVAFLQGAANLLGMAIERQRIERDLTAALEQQEVLLQEGNHRVTNSLQLVSSMLSLQAATATPEMRAPLQDAVARISAIARAHQRLYRTRQIRTLDLGEYLTDVCRDLDDVAAHCDVKVAAAMGIQIATDRAIPISLLVTELITNAAKHAYERGTSDCLIWITVERNGDDAVTIKIRDAGRGVPEGFDYKKSKGLGMRIVSAFLTQLRATLRIERQAPGTEFVLEIPLAAE